MKMFRNALLAGSVALSSVGASAELISTDWLVEGDNLVTLNTVSGKEYLDLTQTKGMSIDMVKSLMSTTYSGWHIASFAEMDGFLGESFTSFNHLEDGKYTPGPWPSYENKAQSNEIFKYSTLVGSNSFVSPSQNYSYSIGYYYTEENGVGYAGSLYAQDVSSKKLHYYGLDNDSSSLTSTSWTNHGVWLVSNGGATYTSINDPSINIGENGQPAASVPLPATGAILLLALSGFGIRKTVKGKHKRRL